MPVSSATQPTVLLAGSSDWQDSLAERLARDGTASTLRASTSTEVRLRCEDTDVDCVVTGTNLADGTCLDLLTQTERLEACPVVVCSSRASAQFASECLRAGASDFVAFAWISPTYEELTDRILAAIDDDRKQRIRTKRADAFDATFEDDLTATWLLDPAGRVERTNRTARTLVDTDSTYPDDGGLDGGGGVDGSRTGQTDPGESDDGVGEVFWRLPCWEEARADVEQLLAGVRTTRRTDRSVIQLDEGDLVIELSVLPIGDRDSLRGLLVEASDITERVSIYRELRASEALHRITLNNMTDTVLVTDDDGVFTYICPNVHFIFGYSVAEIREMGTIDELLGEGFFDREELASEGVLTNVECTTRDKAGEEHTLLVNVREVDIQGGTMLFSCRDVTTRKQREDALTTLQGTTRDLLYAESKTEIAQLLVADSQDILDLPAAAVYLFDSQRNELEPTAYTDRFVDTQGPLEAVPASRDSSIGRAFLENEAVFHGDRWAESGSAADGQADHGRLYPKTPVTPPPPSDADRSTMRSGAFVPIGDHGVLVAGDEAPDRFDSIHRELTDLLAATAEAALDRVERESRLRAQDHTLQRRNQQLTRSNEVNELIRDIGRVLVQAESREAVDQTVCDVLSDSPHFTFAWIGEFETGGAALRPRVWAGEEQGYLDSVSLSLVDADLEPAARTATTGEPTVLGNVAEDLRRDGWQTEALSRGYQSIIAVPLEYEGFRYGVLCVYANSPDVFDDTTSDILGELGELVASTISSLRRTHALLADSQTRLRFETTDAGFVLLQLARAADCSLTFQGGVQQTEVGSSLFVTVTGDVDAVVRAATDLVGIESVQVLGGGDGEPDLDAQSASESAGEMPVRSDDEPPSESNSGLESESESDGESSVRSDDESSSESDDESPTETMVKLQLKGQFIAQNLADHGAVLTSVEADPERAVLVVDVPTSIDSQPIVSHLQERLTGTELVAKHSREQVTTPAHYSSLLEAVTDRQLEVVESAYHGGYFESPRAKSGDEIADSLDISPQAFYKHVRTVEEKLFTALFDDVGLQSTDRP